MNIHLALLIVHLPILVVHLAAGVPLRRRILVIVCTVSDHRVLTSVIAVIIPSALILFGGRCNMKKKTAKKVAKLLFVKQFRLKSGVIAGQHLDNPFEKVEQYARQCDDWFSSPNVYWLYN